MFKDFEVSQMFEDQTHERHRFKLNVEGTDYHGIYHDGEIHWFNPHPEKTLQEEHIQALESHVHEKMADQ
ncbi:DUF5342 family protein [Pseudoneobacillus sp. C159]